MLEVSPVPALSPVRRLCACLAATVRPNRTVDVLGRPVCWLLLAAALPGCVGYQFGPRALYRSDIRTVYVPVVRNETFRHDLGVRLTESIVREIEQSTPFKVTNNPNADSILTCHFVSETKRVLTETAGDDPRALDAVVSVQAAWVDRSGQMLMQNRILPTENMAYTFTQSSRLVPEAGQSVETALQEAIDDLASRIVSQMELRW